MLCMVEYVVENLPKVKLDSVYNKIQVHHTCIYYGGVCTIYVVLLTSLALVVVCVSKINFDMG
jgi:hypothetical protein